MCSPTTRSCIRNEEVRIFNRERRQYEARIEELKAAYEARHQESLRVIKALAEQVEYLRTQQMGPRLSEGVRAADVKVMPEPDFMPDPLRSNPHYLSEEEEDLRALKDGGFLDATEYSLALDQLRAAAGVPIQSDVD